MTNRFCCLFETEYSYTHVGQLCVKKSFLKANMKVFADDIKCISTRIYCAGYFFVSICCSNHISMNMRFEIKPLN